MHNIPDIGPFQKKLNELDQQMSEPDFFSNPEKLQKFLGNTNAYQHLLRHLKVIMG